MKYIIRTIKNYPDDGKHQEVIAITPFDFPFEIRKGEDSYWYNDKEGVQHCYNGGENTTELWIVNLREDEANKSLRDIFEIKVMRDVDKLIAHCLRLCKRSIPMEIKRLADEYKLLKEEVS